LRTKLCKVIEEEIKHQKDIVAWEKTDLNWGKLKDHRKGLERSESEESEEFDILGNLIKALNDSDSIVRREVAISLGMIGDVRALSYLKNVFKDPDKKVQEAARKAVRKIEKQNLLPDERDSDLDYDYYEDKSLPVLNDLSDDANEESSSTEDLITRIIDENDEYMDDIISGL